MGDLDKNGRIMLKYLLLVMKFGQLMTCFGLKVVT
jgi:hypothetical protein